MFHKIAENLLHQGGITVNGSNPWDIHLASGKVLDRAVLYGNLGLGEAYMDGLWDCGRLDEFFHRLISSGVDKRKFLSNIILGVLSSIMNLQKITRAYQVGQKHYDLGNDLYQAMLGPSMTYSCGYWDKTNALTMAQLNKLSLICRKINLRPTESVLEIGCGWGSFAQFAASKHRARVTGLTVSAEQARLAREKCKDLPVEIVMEDYREFRPERTWDKVVSVGMFEHVGPKNYRRFMEIVDRCLAPGGIFLLHTIVGRKSANNTDPWIDKYIFPNGVIPSLKQIYQAADGIFDRLDAHEFGHDYDKTLMAWWRNFEDAWPMLSNDTRYDERFFRMWKYYLLSCAGAFRSGKLQLYQIVFAKPGTHRDYVPVR